MIRLKIVKVTAKRAYAFCPFHEETNPSFEIKLIGPYAGYYYCYGCRRTGKVGMDVLEKLQNRMPKSLTHNKVTDWTDLSNKYEMNYWLDDKLGVPFDVSRDTLHRFNMGWNGRAYTFPMRDGKNTIIGIQLRFPNCKKSAIEGSRLGLFVPNQAGEIDVVHVCEGVSDAATLVDRGYHAIGRPNSCHGNDLVADWIAGNAESAKVWIMADNDKAGIEGALSLAECLGLPEERVLIPSAKDVREQAKQSDIVEWLKWRQADADQKSKAKCTNVG